MTATDRETLERWVEKVASTPKGEPLPDSVGWVVTGLLDALEQGHVRAATRGDDGAWAAVPWVKRGILLAFRAGDNVDMSPSAAWGSGFKTPFSFVDKSTLPTQQFDIERGVRIIPGGSTVRRGAHVAKGVVCMPPMFINVGAYVDEGTMVDSHALVGSCAQIGKRVHISAGSQIGGVLEPVNATPVIVEDEVVVGGNCGVYEGTIVRSRAVLGSGVILTRGTPVYDLVHEKVYSAKEGQPLEIPSGAVVVPGARAITRGFGRDQGLSLQTPIIVKYRDDRTDLSTALENLLR